ncbi:hypothetical protein GGR57DRAFT_108856 [Xylariaceae sp. FL1272]|nr:hypothetical protein GGR57DRAFT_108856 [Xylariaceae sp. FL1272]
MILLATLSRLFLDAQDCSSQRTSSRRQSSRLRSLSCLSARRLQWDPWHALSAVARSAGRRDVGTRLDGYEGMALAAFHVSRGMCPAIPATDESLRGGVSLCQIYRISRPSVP